jgi:methylenetetrahydrofolate--tRNA-(uracil-5-)-methyltransferase
MRPVGLIDPRTKRRPHAVVQLRQDNLAGSLYNLVGFQTNLMYEEQRSVFRLIPGLQQAKFVRFGQMHRNTFVNSPRFLEASLQVRIRKDLFLAGQITGVEGYLGNIATGLLAGVNLARASKGLQSIVLPHYRSASNHDVGCVMPLHNPCRGQDFSANESQFWDPPTYNNGC